MFVHLLVTDIKMFKIKKLQWFLETGYWPCIQALVDLLSIPSCNVVYCVFGEV
jgi:hypothetical protein